MQFFHHEYQEVPKTSEWDARLAELTSDRDKAKGYNITKDGEQKESTGQGRKKKKNYHAQS